MKHLKLLNYCKRMIKSTSAFGNASKGFASNELVQADRAVHRDVTQSSNKNIAIALVGVTILSSGGVIEETKAQSAEFWQQAQEQQRRQQEQEFQMQQQQLWQQRHDPYYACVNGRDTYGYIGDAACGGGVNTNNTAPPPIIQKPSSYGAVAWGENALGTSANQTTKQGAVDVALQKCGDSTCKIVAQYSNQCVASTSGLKKNGKYVWQSSFGMTQKKAEQAALRDCSKHAKNCKVFLSECSLP